MRRLVEDVTALTDVTEGTLKKFLPVIVQSIGHAVYEDIQTRTDVTEIDLGFGELHIKVTSEDIRYRFVPSKELEKALVQCVKGESSPIACTLEQKLQERISKTYKELL